MLNFEDWFEQCKENPNKYFWINDLDNLSLEDEDLLLSDYLEYMKNG